MGATEGTRQMQMGTFTSRETVSQTSGEVDALKIKYIQKVSAVLIHYIPAFWKIALSVFSEKFAKTVSLPADFLLRGYVSVHVEISLLEGRIGVLKLEVIGSNENLFDVGQSKIDSFTRYQDIYIILRILLFTECYLFQVFLW